MIYFDLDELSDRQIYNLIASTVVPRPIAWVLTKNKKEGFNLAPFSFFNALSGTPPIVGIGIGQRDNRIKDTAKNIIREKEFVIHLINEELAEAMNLSSMIFPEDISEVEWLNLALKEAHKTSLGIIKEAPFALECKLIQTIDLEKGGLIALGKVKAVHVKKDAVVDPQRGYLNINHLNIIGRWQSPGWYIRSSDLFQLEAVQRKTFSEES